MDSHGYLGIKWWRQDAGWIASRLPRASMGFPWLPLASLSKALLETMWHQKGLQQEQVAWKQVYPGPYMSYIIWPKFLESFAVGFWVPLFVP